MKVAKGNPQLSALWYTSPPKAVAKCQAALRACKGHRIKAAEKLGVGPRTFYRWLAEHPEILQGIDGLRFLPAVNVSARGSAKAAKTRPK